MFLPAHMAVGAIIDKSSRRWWLTIPLAFMSHPVLDSLNFGDNLLFHGPMDGSLNAIVIAVSAVLGLFLLVKARRYWLGMLFADLADFEWAIFAMTDLDPAKGLHHHYFYPAFMRTEWGLILQLGIVLLLIAVVLMPRRHKTDAVPQMAKPPRLGWGRSWGIIRRPQPAADTMGKVRILKE